MHRLTMFSTVAAVIVFATSASGEDWLQWRGPTGDNHAAIGATAPVNWSETEGIAWRTPLPSRGHSSPTIVGDRIYLTTGDAEAESQSLLIFDRKTGKPLLQKVIHTGGLPPRRELHPNNTHASSTVASDGKRVFTVFFNHRAVWVTAFDLQGKQLWQREAIGFNPQRYKFGFGSSPVVLNGMVIVSSEYDGSESGIIALDTATGEPRWETPRTKSLSYSTPGRAIIGGQTQLLLSGNRSVAGYDPESGKQLWTTPAPAHATCGTMVTAPSLGLAFAGGGFPDTFVLGVRTTGDHEIVWQNRVKCYEQSLLVVGEYLYAVSDRGIAYCWRGADGQEMWKERLGGSYSSSPLLVDGKIYVTNERGATFVYAASPDSFQSIATNQLGDEAFATPTPADGRLYHRYADSSSGERQEFLVAIGQ